MPRSHSTKFSATLYSEDSELLEFTLNYAEQICNNAPEAVESAKRLVAHVAR